MSVAAVRGVVRYFGSPADPPSDADLVTAFAARRDPGAFAELVRRHGPTVLGACRRVLGDSHDAEDAFQAVFLVLAQKVCSIRPAGAVGGWLYGVAVRTANKAKVAAARRRKREMIAAAAQAIRQSEQPEGVQESTELRSALDTELARLPEALRAAIVLCDLHGKTRAEAAAELGCPEGTVAARLHRGRKRLADVLARRGFAMPVAGLAAVLAPAPVSATLSQSTFALVTGTATPIVHALAREVLRSMTTTIHTLAVGVLALLAGGLLAAGAMTNTPNPANPANEPSAATVSEAAPLPNEGPHAPPDHGNRVHAVSYAPDGKRFLSVGGGKGIVWATASQKKLFEFDAEFAAFSGDGKELFALGGDEFRTLDGATGKTTATKNRQQPRPVLGGRFAAFSDTAKMWVEHDSVRHHLRAEFKGELPKFADQKDHNPLGSTIVMNHGRGGAFSPDNTLFAGIHAATTDYKETACLSIWEPFTGARVGTITRTPNHPVHAFAWSPDGKEIAVAYANCVRVYLTDPKVIAGIDKGEDDKGPFTRVRSFDVSDPTAVAWSKDGKTLAVATRKDDYVGWWADPKIIVRSRVHIIDATTGKELRTFAGFSDNVPVISLAFAPDGKQLLCGAGFFPGDGPEAISLMPHPPKDAKGLRVLNLDEPAKPKAPAWEERKAMKLVGWLGGSVAYSPDGKTMYVGGTGGNVRAYDAATRKLRWEHEGGGHFAAVAISPDGKTLALTYKDGACLLDATTGKVQETLEEKDSEPLEVGWFPDSIVLGGADAPARETHKVIFGSARGYTVKSWLELPKVSTIRSRTVAAEKEPADKFAVPLAVAPDGKRVVVTGPIDPKTGKNVLWAWSAGSGAANQLLEGHKAIVTAAAWSKDGKTIVSGDADGVVITWDATTFKETARVNLGGRVAALAISPDAKHVAAAVISQPEEQDKPSYYEDVYTWTASAPQGKPTRISRQQLGGPFSGLASVAFAPDGKTLAAVFANFTHLARSGELVGTVRTFTLAEPEQPKQEPLTWVQQIVHSPDGKWCAVVPGGVHDASGLKRYDLPANAYGFSADGKKLFAMADKVLECDADTGKVVKEHPRPKTDLAWHFVRFSPDGKLYAAHFGFNVRVYDTATGFEPVRLGDQHEPGSGTIFGTAGKDLFWSADGKQLAAVGVMTEVGGKMGLVVWDTESGKRTEVHNATINDGPLSGAFTPDGDRLAIGGKDRVEVWVIRGDAKKNPERTYRPGGATTAIAYSKDGKLVALGVRKPIPNGADKKPAIIGHKTEVHVYNAATGEEVKRFDGFEGVNHNATTKLAVNALAFSPDGNRVFAGTGLMAMAAFGDDVPRKGEFKVFSLDGKPIPAPEQKWTEAVTLNDHGALVNGVAVSPDGKTFAAATEGNVTLWDAATRKVLWKYSGVTVDGTRAAPYGALAFSPDGKHVCVGGKIDVTRLDAKTGKNDPWTDDEEIQFGTLQALAFSPDGKRLAGSDGYRTRVRELAPNGAVVNTPRIPAPKKGERGPFPRLPAAVAWSKDGKTLAIITHAKREGKWPVVLWSPNAGLTMIPAHADTVTAIAWSPDGKLLVSGDEKGTAIAWDAATGKELWREKFTGRDDTAGRINALAISPADNTVAVAVSLGSGKGPERVVLLAPDGKRVGFVQGHSIPIATVAWAPDGKFLVTGAGAAGQVIEQKEPPVGEVVVWVPKPE